MSGDGIHAWLSPCDVCLILCLRLAPAVHAAVAASASIEQEAAVDGDRITAAWGSESSGGAGRRLQQGPYSAINPFVRPGAAQSSG